jgi:cation transport regulator ChaC
MKKATKHKTFNKCISYITNGVEAKYYPHDDALCIENINKQKIYISGDELEFLKRVIKEIENEISNSRLIVNNSANAF